MNRKISSPFALLVIVLFSSFVLSCDKDDDETFSEIVKIALRDVGNELLLKNQDSTSLVLPVVKLDDLKYQLTFKSQLSIEPGTLVTIVQESLEKASLPKFYHVEVVQCLNSEVAYSYRMTNVEETTIVPCSERVLPEACYIIEVKFTNKANSAFNNSILFYIIGFIGLLGALLFYKRKKTKTLIPEIANSNFDSIGSFQFYPEQNKLIKAATEISLSKKECELLVIFAANPNQIIKRDELTKKVWEDNGVFVGRSLDTYISKLRKKLKDDESIKLTNVHGVGYKLEVLR